jgi:hypothetical protein
MSKQCGDTARYHRLRKQKIARRLRSRELRQSLMSGNVAANGGKAAPPPAAKPE